MLTLTRMAINSPKILTFRFTSEEDESKVILEFGTQSRESKIPKGHGIVRVAAILDEKNQLSAMETITEANP